MTRTRCECCHFPIILRDADSPHVCTQCVMIATGEKCADGSSFADGLSQGEVNYITMRVRSILHR